MVDQTPIGIENTQAVNGVDVVSTLASQIGFDLVDVTCLIGDITQMTQTQTTAMAEAQAGAERILQANAVVRATIDSVSSIAEDTHVRVTGSADDIAQTLDHARSVAHWVGGIEGRITALETTLAEVTKSNTMISGIAKQVNILAINATIEAARAGDSGKGFAVVADAINELSRRTAKAADGINDNIAMLSAWTKDLRQDAKGMTDTANTLTQEADQTGDLLHDIARGSRETHGEIQRIKENAEEVAAAGLQFRPLFQDLGQQADQLRAGVDKASSQMMRMVDASEGIVQKAAALGSNSPDAKFITYVQGNAAKISALFEEALDAGRISMAQLMSRELTLIEGTNPQQFMAPYTALTDTLLPPLLEEALEFDRRVVFSAAINPDGYLPTHNRKFSHPQGPDASQNAARSRNRRVFDDRVGRKAGKNQSPFLLQVYRRDMGNGEHVMMKDLSAPVFVKGRHWGGLRLAYGL